MLRVVLKLEPGQLRFLRALDAGTLDATLLGEIPHSCSECTPTRVCSGDGSVASMGSKSARFQIGASSKRSCAVVRTERSGAEA